MVYCAHVYLHDVDKFVTAMRGSVNQPRTYMSVSVYIYIYSYIPSNTNPVPPLHTDMHRYTTCTPPSAMRVPRASHMHAESLPDPWA